MSNTFFSYSSIAPNEDGTTHVRVDQKSNTKLGKLLAPAYIPNTNAPSISTIHGSFYSIHTLMTWAATGGFYTSFSKWIIPMYPKVQKAALYNLHKGVFMYNGVEYSVTTVKSHCENMEDMLIQCYWKLLHEERFAEEKEMLINNTLPFVVYYLHGDKPYIKVHRDNALIVSAIKMVQKLLIFEKQNNVALHREDITLIINVTDNIIEGTSPLDKDGNLIINPSIKKDKPQKPVITEQEIASMGFSILSGNVVANNVVPLAGGDVEEGDEPEEGDNVGNLITHEDKARVDEPEEEEEEEEDGEEDGEEEEEASNEQEKPKVTSASSESNNEMLVI